MSGLVAFIGMGSMHKMSVARTSVSPAAATPCVAAPTGSSPTRKLGCLAASAATTAAAMALPQRRVRQAGKAASRRAAEHSADLKGEPSNMLGALSRRGLSMLAASAAVVGSAGAEAADQTKCMNCGALGIVPCTLCKAAEAAVDQAACTTCGAQGVAPCKLCKAAGALEASGMSPCEENEKAQVSECPQCRGLGGRSCPHC